MGGKSYAVVKEQLGVTGTLIEVTSELANRFEKVRAMVEKQAQDADTLKAGLASTTKSSYGFSW
jgi:hypothetical protein